MISQPAASADRRVSLLLLGAAAFMVSIGTRILDPLLKILASPREFHVPLDQVTVHSTPEMQVDSTLISSELSLVGRARRPTSIATLRKIAHHPAAPAHPCPPPSRRPLLLIDTLLISKAPPGR